MSVPRNEFLTTFGLVSRRLKSEAERRLVQHGVHAGQQFILECLWENDGLTMSEIATRIRVEAPTITRAVQRMTGSGLVRSAADHRDGRRVRIWLTPRGDRLRETLPRVLDSLEEAALSELTVEQRAEFMAMLRKVGEAIGAPEPGGAGGAAPSAARPGSGGADQVGADQAEAEAAVPAQPSGAMPAGGPAQPGAPVPAAGPTAAR